VVSDLPPRNVDPFAQQEHTQQDAIGGQGGHSAKRPDWACKPYHFLGQSQSEGLHFPVSVAKRDFAIFASSSFRSPKRNYGN
jgi:hypothetical protein